MTPALTLAVTLVPVPVPLWALVPAHTPALGTNRLELLTFLTDGCEKLIACMMEAAEVHFRSDGKPVAL